MRFYVKLMKDMDDINHRWGLRHVMTLLTQCIVLAVGICQLINEMHICSTSETHLFECDSFTIWQHVLTSVVLVTIFLDFYGICFCAIDMLMHIIH